VIAKTDPPLLGVTAAVVTFARGARLFHWAQDIYPELAIELGGASWLKLLRPLRNWAWRRADGCLTLGTDMAGVLAQAGVDREKIFVSSNWAPAGLKPTPPSAALELRREWALEDKFVVAYSGNLGRVHDLEPVLDLAEAMRSDPHVAFLFVGSGAQRVALENLAHQRGLANVQFRPPQPRARLAESLAVGDVQLVTVRPGCERYVFPSKFYGITAVGRPVIFIGPRDCELARLIREQGFGWACERTEIAALAATIRMLAGDPATCKELGARAARFASENGGLTQASALWARVVGGAQACEAQEENVTSIPL
jgi:glycosyltransferase involved in cell wall biosynthesis